MTQRMNQFSQTALKGQLDMLVNPTTFSVQLDPASEVEYLLPGAAVILVDATSDQIVVDEAAADDNSFAFVLYNPKKEKFYPGDTMEVVAAFSVLFMEAGSGGVSRGDLLEYVPTGEKVITNNGNPVCGIALDNASATELFRMMVFNSMALQVAITSGSINGVAIGGSDPSTGVFTDLTSTGTTLLGNAAGDSIVLTGIVDLTGSTIKGATPFVFEGATADSSEGSFAVADFSADRTFTIPDGTGTFDLHNQTPLVITPGATPAYAPGASQDLATLTPAENETIAATTTGAVIGKTYRIKVTTSGTDSFTLTFGSNFKTTGTLATGTDTGKVFVISFVFDGTNFVEAGRTTAM